MIASVLRAFSWGEASGFSVDVSHKVAKALFFGVYDVYFSSEYIACSNRPIFAEFILKLKNVLYVMFKAR